MSYLPICLNLDARRILIVGGGWVAWQKLNGLLPFTQAITVCAPQLLEIVKALPIQILERCYSSELLEDVSLVYACTNDPAVNQQIRADAWARRILVNVADDPVSADFISPAICNHADLTIAVNSNGQNVKKAIHCRNHIKNLLEEEG
jgi:siroheme synthase-like protein